MDHERGAKARQPREQWEAVEKVRLSMKKQWSAVQWEAGRSDSCRDSWDFVSNPEEAALVCSVLAPEKQGPWQEREAWRWCGRPGAAELFCEPELRP